jgi:hypothetical protein
MTAPRLQAAAPGAPPPWIARTGPQAGAPGERHLLAAIERLARTPQAAGREWTAVVLHVSRLPPPGPRPHHGRIARAVMQEAGQRTDGQVFSLRNGDVVLLARAGLPALAPLSDRLRAMFAPEAGAGASVVSAWALEDGHADLLAYASERLRGPEAPVPDDAPVSPVAMIDAVAATIAGARPTELIQRQAAVHFDPLAGDAGAVMRIAYQELTFSLDVLGSRLGSPLRLGDDATLLLHLGRYLDQRMLQVLRLEHGSGSPLDVGARNRVDLHLNLSLAGVLSDEFAALAALCCSERRGLGVEVSLIEAVDDRAAFGRAAARLRATGAHLVLDGVSHLALLLARPWLLPADLLKLDWSPRMIELPEAERAALDVALAQADPGRVILHRAETEAAVRWGLARRIRRFQGWHIDQMLAAQRMLRCPGAGDCMPRQCAERSAATGGAARGACTNLDLLDAGLPMPAAAAPGRPADR